MMLATAPEIDEAAELAFRCGPSAEAVARRRLTDAVARNDPAAIDLVTGAWFILVEASRLARRRGSPDAYC